MLTVDEDDQTALRYREPTPHRPKVMFATSSVEAVRSMVTLNMGITILSNMVYRPWSLAGRHVEVRPVTDHVPTMDVGLAWRRDTEMSPPVRVFYEYLDRTFRGSGHGFVNADVSPQRMRRSKRQAVVRAGHPAGAVCPPRSSREREEARCGSRTP